MSDYLYPAWASPRGTGIGWRPVSEAALPFALRRTPSQAPSATERAIFAATEDLLRNFALGDLTIEQILQRAGVSRTTFYKRFGSKYSVVSAMLNELQSELVDLMRPWSARHGAKPGPALREAITAVAAVWQQHRPILRASSEIWHTEPEVGIPWASMMARFVDDIAHEIQAERFQGVAPPGVDSKALARTLAWSSERMLYLAGFGLCGELYEFDVVDPLVATWVGAIYQSVDE